MSDDHYNGLPPGGDTVTGGQPFVFKRGAMITKTLPHTQAAFDEESYSWMESNADDLLRGIIQDINLHNATPEMIRKFISNRYGREAIAMRAEQAARYYLATRGNGG